MNVPDRQVIELIEELKCAREFLDGGYDIQKLSELIGYFEGKLNESEANN